MEANANGSSNNHRAPAGQTRRVVVTGMGAVSPLGNTVKDTWEGIAAGRSGIGVITLFDHSNIDTHIAGEVKNFDPGAHFGAKDARRLDRVAQLALVAAREALDAAKLIITEDNTWDTAVVIGSGIGGIGTTLAEHAVMLQKSPRRISPFAVPMMLPDTATGQIAIHFGIRGPNVCIVTACASGVNALGEAFEMIRAGRANAAVAGGCDAAINPFSISAFNNMGALSSRNDDPQGACRPFDKTRDGFVTAEGAGMLIVEELEHAKARGAHIHAELLGYGCTDDAFHITSPDERGPAMAMRIALRQAGVAPAQIDYLNAHGTSTTLNDINETKAIKTVFGEAAYDVRISSTKSMTGHALGGVGALEAIFCVKAIEQGIVPPTINYVHPDPECDLNYTPNTAVNAPVKVAMSNSFGFGGHNGCIVISEFNE